ncbi:aromatic-ring-hydroxylating dioxygenase subunit beta [Thauera sinica]|uniref:Aromatic-ring-hydroxylating dioxygenase subunit beta n=1 Tax=Thauera sinica TaxID=2665146 RepID=A0ABW1AX16_9RHOO|nr:aromatic-ring-hydroxylating dioxygenase subunit beta [Thauera sp. K11]ATE61206.1 aromatic-ring-hydroxylating dioxygenase [Thauera sp. K11]
MNTDNTAAASAASRYQPPSHYVDDAFYRWLGEVSADLAAAVPDRAAGADAALHDEVGRLLTVESRLLDQHAYADWLDLYLPECAYWIPSTRPAGDPRLQITLEFHDRRRLMDRIARLGTGLAYSQLPASRTARQLGGLEVWAAPGGDGGWHARCNFLVAESRAGRSRMLAGWYGFVVRRVDGTLRLALKQVNLLDPEEPQGNNSFFL